MIRENLFQLSCPCLHQYQHVISSSLVTVRTPSKHLTAQTLRYRANRLTHRNQMETNEDLDIQDGAQTSFHCSATVHANLLLMFRA